ncbi:MAG TPA: glycosyltransferase family 4 protein [Pseudonocardiaceae bacterium]|jgi:glycosyltransferase involved in cell wall biosynthesis|nr:glycosyltransferase family 4 protein [Pseudonocardiaceae bacterium]
MIRMLSVSLITLGDPGQLTGGYLYHRRMAEAASAHDARLRFVSFPALPFPLPAARAGVVLQRACSPADVVVLDSIAAAFLAPLLVLRRSAIPLVAILHQPPGGIDHNALRTWLQAALDRLVYRQAAALVLASAALAPELPADLRARAVVVPPGRDAGPPAAVADDLRCGRRAALLYVGNWVPRKGLLELLAAVAALPPDAATLHLAGRHDIDRRYAARVHARLAAPELAGRVVVHGPLNRAQVSALYHGADVFVLPSIREPYGTAYGEAMAAGLPVVGWRAGNLPHLATHEREGLILPPGDINGLTAALRRLINDAPYRRSLGQAARQRAAALPTWEESAGQLFTMLRAVANGGRLR